jgi:uncharacterized protein YbjT (DUF2867 family)
MKLQLNRRALIGGAMALGVGSARAAQAERSPVLLVGATARSAPAIVQLALEQGRKITALARRPEAVVERLPARLREHPGLKTVKGDVYDVQSLADAMTGAESVISLIAPAVDPNGPDITSIDIFSVGTANLIFAMQRKGNRRIIPLSSGGTEMIPAAQPPADAWATLRFVWHIRGVYQDMLRMENIVRESGLDYVIPRPRRFVNEPARNDLKFAVERPQPPVISSLTYADFAAWVLAAADGREYLGKTVGIYTDKVVSAPG